MQSQRYELPEYHVWASMKGRCLNQRHPDYQLYGGRGITVCDQWLDFDGFYAYMGSRPTPKHSLERKDNNGNYCPGNCVWATNDAQQNNRRNNRLVEYMGQSKTIAEWARDLGIDRHSLRTRLNRGWSVDRAMNERIHRNALTYEI